MDLPRKAIRPEGSNCISRGSVPEFARKPIATRGRLGPMFPHLDPPKGLLR